MKIIEIKALENGGHRNQLINFEIAIPEGWAVIPEELEITNFPFGEVETETVNGIVTVTRWIPGAIPEDEPIPEAEPTVEELLDILLGVDE